jgi:hypothetical protein
VTEPPTAIRRRGQAAAGTHSLRRPWAARGRARLILATAAAVAAVAAGGVAIAGCGGSAPAAAPPGNVFTSKHDVSLGQVQAEVTSLYSDHPGIASFTVQDVQYTTKSRDTVLRQCTSAGAAASAQDAETGQIVACAPMIFFLYSYGIQASVPTAVTAAGDLYWYAITHISGPVSAKTSLNELLQSWKLPVPSLSAAEQTSAAAASIITAADDSILTQHSVHMVITDQTAGAATDQRITADIGTVTGTELITFGAATATIHITRQAAYFTGNSAGLAAYIGLSGKAAAKAAAHWVVIKAGTTEYQALATENTLSSLPSSILPPAADVTGATTATVGGHKQYILDWKTTPSGSATSISARLTLTATPQVLPVSEVIMTKDETKTITFSNWGAPFTVTTPASAIPYAKVAG